MLGQQRRDHILMGVTLTRVYRPSIHNGRGFSVWLVELVLTFYANLLPGIWHSRF